MTIESGPPYRVNFIITADDVVAFVRLLQRRLNTIGVILGLSVMTVGGIIGLLARDPLTGVWTFLVGLVFVVLSSTEFLDRWRIRRGAKSLVGATGSFVIDGRGITADPPTDAGPVPWSDVTDVVENERVLIVKRGRTPIVWIPKRALGTVEQAAELSAYIRGQSEAAPRAS